ncbi:response regulator transcription factor [Mycoplasma sp. P36-A1]|uniref:response regulator transcription factor n=1 Tax=Mycoplasma sp. P36-A1 TaxID=3252900 RepID=UPI003C2B238C
MKKILVIEDESALQMLLEYDLKEQYELEFADNGQEGLEKLQNNFYDLAIVDWMLPQRDGFSVIQEIRKTNDDLKIIMLTAKNEEMDIVRALDAGADDYMTKPFSSRELNARINALLRKTKKGNSHIIKFDDVEIDLDKRSTTKDGQEIVLSKIEFDMLVYLIENKNIVISREKIMDKVWGHDELNDLRVIDVHISSLKRKLDLKNRISSKRGVGYLFTAWLSISV